MKNEIICIMGDFNFNLLNYESHNDSNEFINFMVSHHLLPHILQPTRVTDHSATIINNIFTNEAEYDTITGNILSQLADHFSQFLIMKKKYMFPTKMQLTANMTTQNLIKINLCQLF